MVRKDGSLLPVLVNATAVRDAGGHYVMSRSTMVDLSERKRAEQALQDSEALYRSLVESLPLAIYRKDLQARVTFANQRFCQGRGKPLDQVVHELRGLTGPAPMLPKWAFGYVQSKERYVSQTELIEVVQVLVTLE